MRLFTLWISASSSEKYTQNYTDAKSEVIQSIFGNSGEKTVRVSTAPIGSPVAASPVVLTVTHFPEGEVVQLGLFPGFEPVAPIVEKRRR